MTLTGKHVVVTGANGALGRAVVVAASQLGASVTALDRVFSDDFATEADKAVVKKVTVDLLDAAATRDLVAQFDAVDMLANIAGGFAMGTAAWADNDDEWQRMFAINVTTLRNAVKAVVPGMLARGRGSLVNVGAYGALQGQPEMSAYSAAKNVVMRLTESLAAELRDRGINVNAVLPGVIDTPANRAAMPQADTSRWVAPADLAQVICFLGSDAARAVNGALLPVTGLG